MRLRRAKTMARAFQGLCGIRRFRSTMRVEVREDIVEVEVEKLGGLPPGSCRKRQC